MDKLQVVPDGNRRALHTIQPLAKKLQSTVDQLEDQEATSAKEDLQPDRGLETGQITDLHRGAGNK